MITLDLEVQNVEDLPYWKFSTRKSKGNFDEFEWW